MKKLTIIIIFIILILVAGVGLVAYTRMTKKSDAVNPVPTMTTSTQVPGAGFPTTTPGSALPSPIPTVAQISLTITDPTNNSTVTTPTLSIKGVTLPKADVFVNDSEVAADAQGKFTVQVTLDEGENTLVVTANDANGNFAEQDLTVTYNSAQ